MLKKNISLTFIAVISLLAIATGLKSLYPIFHDLFHYRAFVESKAEELLQEDVSIGGSEFILLNGFGFKLSKVSIKESKTGQELFMIDCLVFRLKIIPLFFKKIIFDKIEIFNPVLNIERDSNGIYNFDLNNFLKIAGKKSGGNQSFFPIREVRSIAVEKGKINFVDKGLSSLSTQTALNIFKADISQNLPSRSYTLLIKGDIPGDKPARIKISSNLRKIPSDPNVFQIDGKVEIGSLKASLLHDYLGESLPIKDVNGLFDISFNYSWYPGKKFHSKGQVLFNNLKLDSPDFFLSPPPSSSGNFQFNVNCQNEILNVNNFSFSLNKIFISGNCQLKKFFTPQDRSIFLEIITSSPLPWKKLKGHLPLKLFPVKITRFIDNSIQNCSIDSLGLKFNGKLVDFRQLSNFRKNNLVSANLDFQNLILNLNELPGPIHNLRGSLKFENSNIHLSRLQGEWQKSKLLSGDGTVLHIFDSPKLHLSLDLDLDLGDVASVMGYGEGSKKNRPLINFVNEARNLKGRAGLNLNINKSLQEGSSFLFDGHLNLNGAEFFHPGIKLPITRLSGNIKLENGNFEITELSCNWGNSPLVFTGRIFSLSHSSLPYIQFSGKSSQINAKEIISILPFSNFYQGKGIISGKIKLFGSMANVNNMQIIGSLDLKDVNLKSNNTSLEILNLNGNIKFTKDWLTLNSIHAHLGGSQFEVEGILRDFSQPHLSFCLASPYLDLTKIISYPKINQGFVYKKALRMKKIGKLFSSLIKNDFLKEISMSGEIAIESGKTSCYKFCNFKGKIESSQEAFIFESEYDSQRGHFNERQKVELTSGDTFKFHLITQIDDINIDEPPAYCPKTLGISDLILTGDLSQTLSLEGQVKKSDGMKNYLNGGISLNISQGSIEKFNILGKVFSLINISQLFKLKFPDLTSKGMPFKYLKGDFTIKNGIADTNNFILDSEAIKILGVGKIDLIKDEINMKLGAQPLQSIDRAIRIVPLMGKILTGEDKSIIVAYFDITGNMKSPKVSFSPISSLKNGMLDIFKGVFSLPRKILPQGKNKKRQEEIVPVQPPGH